MSESKEQAIGCETYKEQLERRCAEHWKEVSAKICGPITHEGATYLITDKGIKAAYDSVRSLYFSKAPEVAEPEKYSYEWLLRAASGLP